MDNREMIDLLLSLHPFLGWGENVNLHMIIIIIDLKGRKFKAYIGDFGLWPYGLVEATSV